MTSSKYEILQSWYLARLRKMALKSAEAEGLTPQSLIAADRELVEKLIAERAESHSGATTRAAILSSSQVHLPGIGLSKLNFFVLFGLTTFQLLLLAALVFVNQTTKVQAQDHLVVLVSIYAAICVASTIGTALFLHKWLAEPLATVVKRIKQRLAGQFDFPDSGSDGELEQVNDLLENMSNRLLEVTEKERAIVDFSPDIICSLDPQARILATNMAFQRLLGLGTTAILGRSIDTFLLPEDAQKLKETLGAVRKDSSARSCDLRAVKADGSICYLRCSPEWSGSQEQYFCVVTDISASKELELVKSEFVHMISHDLRTPLSSLKFTLQVIESGSYGTLSPEGLKTISTAERSVERLISLIGQLLDLDKSESGHLELDLKTVELSTVIQTTVDQLSGFAAMNKVKLKTKPTELLVKGEEGRLVQVLVNLLSNAIKYSPEGGTVNIEATDLDDFVEIKVIDQGKGVPAAYQRLIFERYRQVSVQDSSELKGSGLGLAISKALVSVHGGTIGVTSEENKGSTFWFTLKKASPAVVSQS